MALDANVVATHGIESLRIDDVLAGRMGDVETAGAVTFFTSNVPLGDLTIVDVVVDRMATVAGGTGWTVEVGRAVEGYPPIGS